jgi:hypothetical protein
MFTLLKEVVTLDGDLLACLSKLLMLASPPIQVGAQPRLHPHEIADQQEASHKPRGDPPSQHVFHGEDSIESRIIP